MNKFLNDITTDLNEEINISNPDNKKAHLSKLKWPNVSDIWNNLKQEINTKKDKKIKISKNKTEAFDSFLKWDKKEEIIDTVSPKKNLAYYTSSIKNFFYKNYKKITLSQTKIKVPSTNLTIFEMKNLTKIWLFILLLVVVWLGTKITVEKCVTWWYENLLALKNDFKDINKAKSNIKKARIKFVVSKALLTPISFIPNENIKNVTSLVDWWNQLSKLLTKSIKIWETIWHELHRNKWIENISFTKILEDIRNNYEEIYSLFYSSLSNFSRIGDMWDEKLNAKLAFVIDKLFLWLNILDVINNHYDEVLSILWANETKKYLVVFQNNDEIRPTWGFMWSTATISIKDWKITNLENSDIYAFEWDINKVYTKKEKAPEWLNKITTSFWIRDANYYPFFKDSSQKIKYFLDMINYDIDWIVYINQNIILDLLEKIWWVESKVLDMHIDEKNFSLVISTLVEAKVFKVWTLGSPKQVLFDFANELYEKLIKEKKYYDYANILLKHIQSKDIVFYSFNPLENSFLWKLWVNWDFHLNEKLDFNYPVYTSIWGNKTDRYKEYRYDKVVDKAPNSCDYVTKLEIYNSHMFSNFEDEKVNNLLDKYEITHKRDILNIQWRGDNKSYLRVLIPKNSEVLPSVWQTVYDYDNYKVVELYVTTQKLETSKNIIQYTIKNPECDDYSYKFFKQAWIIKYNINFDVFWEENKYSNITSDFIYKRDE